MTISAPSIGVRLQHLTGVHSGAERREHAATDLRVSR